MNAIALQVVGVDGSPLLVQPAGQFQSFSEWVNKAESWIGGRGAACFDAKGRLCRIGSDFMRARDEGAFPIAYFLPGRAPKRLQLKRTKGWKKPEGAVLVSRPSRFGNPFRVVERGDGVWVVQHGTEFQLLGCATYSAAVRLAVAKFRANLLRNALPFTLDDVRRELRGRDFCHAAILLEEANRPEHA